MDQDQLHKDILAALPTDPLYVSHSTSPKPHYSVTSDGFLRHNKLIYVPDFSDLRLRILHNKHDHVLSGHPGQNKITSLIQRDYTWPGLRDIKSCTTCMRAKPQCHKPYGLLKQLPVPQRP